MQKKLRYSQAPIALAVMMTASNAAMVLANVALGKLADVIGVKQTLRMCVSLAARTSVSAYDMMNC